MMRMNNRSKVYRTHMIETWDVQGGQASLAWAEGMYRDLFYR